MNAFKKGSNVTLGGGLSVALGPLGRNLEGDIALRNAAAFYTYRLACYRTGSHVSIHVHMLSYRFACYRTGSHVIVLVLS